MFWDMYLKDIYTSMKTASQVLEAQYFMRNKENCTLDFDVIFLPLCDHLTVCAVTFQLPHGIPTSWLTRTVCSSLPVLILTS